MLSFGCSCDNVWLFLGPSSFCHYWVRGRDWDWRAACPCTNLPLGYCWSRQPQTQWFQPTQERSLEVSSTASDELSVWRIHLPISALIWATWRPWHMMSCTRRTVRKSCQEPCTPTTSMWLHLGLHVQFELNILCSSDSSILPEELASQSVRLKEEQLRREEEKV